MMNVFNCRCFLNIDYIGQNLLELRYLNMSWCKGRVTDSDLKSISNLPKLKVLRLEGVTVITGIGLGNFANLKELNCSFCHTLKDDGLIRLLRCACELEFLDISFCRKITTSVIKVAIEETKKRTNNIVLRLQIGTAINVDKIEDVSPLLYLV